MRVSGQAPLHVVRSFTQSFARCIVSVNSTPSPELIGSLRNIAVGGSRPLVQMPQLISIAEKRTVQPIVDHPDLLFGVLRILGLHVPCLDPVMNVVRSGTDFHRIADLLPKIQFFIHELDSFIHFGAAGKEPTRNYLWWCKDLVEVLLFCWNPGTTMEIQNSAGSQEVQMVIAGTLTEKTFMRKKRKEVEVSEHRLDTRAVTTISSDLRRIVSNETDGLALSIHFCWPPVNRETVEKFD